MLPQRLTDSVDSPSTIRLKQPSTIAEIRKQSLELTYANALATNENTHYQVMLEITLDRMRAKLIPTVPTQSTGDTEVTTTAECR